MGGVARLFTLLRSPLPAFSSSPYSAFRLTRLTAAPFSSASSCFSLHQPPHRRLNPNPPSRSAFSDHFHTLYSPTDASGESVDPPHPWPEWLKLVEHVVSGGYSDRKIHLAGEYEDDDSFSASEALPEEFIKMAESCVSFARDRPELLRFLSRKDIEIIVENVSPFLFKNGLNSVRRMRSFVSGNDDNAGLKSERAQTIDLMRYLVTCARLNPVTSVDDTNIRVVVEASARKLLGELFSVSGVVGRSTFVDSVSSQSNSEQQRFQRPPGQDVEMKRGDWICPVCRFMNFARNMKCLQCQEARPKRQLTGGEWECPQCDFFNYGRNMSCLRCDSKRPGEASSCPSSISGDPGFSRSSSFEQILNKSITGKSEMERKLAENDEKAERWFRKVSQLDSSDDLSSAIDDEDFPEIMPLRKGVNRFVVSKRKTPLERRLANSQNRKMNGNESQTGFDDATRLSISESLDRILGSSSGERASVPENRFNTSDYRQSVSNQPRNPDDQLCSDMFRQSPKSYGDSFPSPSQVSGSNSETSSLPATNGKMSSSVFSPTGHAVPSSEGGEDFPNTMPLRRGENRFLVSKKNDRSLTSPQYKRRIALEQANNSNFVPFVPFPPDYFAKKDRPPESEPTNDQAPTNPTSPSDLVQGLSQKKPNSMTSFSAKPTEQASDSNFAPFAPFPPDYLAKKDRPPESERTNDRAPTNRTSPSDLGQGLLEKKPNSMASSSWGDGGYSGKSLEGSAVKEPEPLDMSEEAKAERWFRRVAQIKDISELSQIPDEDFPSIMPMRKGVNRFVVSKRKTPLERRLTSREYRKSLPVTSSDPNEETS